MNKSRSIILFLGLVSFLLAGITPFLDGRTIQSHEELSQLREEGYVMALGYPLPFVEQSILPLDPPMPHSFGFSFWHIRSIDIINYFCSVGIIFAALVVIQQLCSVSKNSR